jgi:hypothetical protein
VTRPANSSRSSNQIIDPPAAGEHEPHYPKCRDKRRASATRVRTGFAAELNGSTDISQRFERVAPEKVERLGQLARSEAVEPVGTVFVLDKPFANLYWKIKTLHRADPMLRHPSDFTLFDVLLRESRI